VIPAIEAAHNEGYYVITCDYLPDNPAHKYADEFHNVSIVEKEAVLELAQRLHVDGILSFATDPGVEPAAWVCEKLGLPGSPYESVKILQNKALFREFLTEKGFNVPKARGYAAFEEAAADAGYFSWPVIVKPVDSAGSKGVTRVDSPESLQDAVDYALSFSLSKRFIVEEFITQKGYSSDTDCFSIDGELVFCSFNNQRFDADAENPYTPSGFSWPSSMSAESQAELRSELQRLMRLLNMGTTIYNIETRVGTDGKAYIMEVSPRAGGNRLAEMLRIAGGQDLITNAVRAAVGDPVDELHDPVYDGCYAEYILHADESGTFVELNIDEEFASSFVVERDLWVTAGDEVHAFSGANETIGTLVLRFENQDELEMYMSDIKKYVRVCVDSKTSSGGGGAVSRGVNTPYYPLSPYFILSHKGCFA